MPDYRAFRVVRAFKWGGWLFAPQNGCRCNCAEPQTRTYFDTDARQEVTVTVDGPVTDCTRQPGKSCRCAETVCGCPCGMNEQHFAGDIWIVDVGSSLERQEGRVYSMVEISRFARPDVVAQETAITPDGQVKDEYKHLLEPPKELTAAGRGRRR